MAKTYQEVSDLSEQTSAKVASSPAEWMNYLDTASRMYKYSFQEQLLIHAQKPESTACAPFALWNSRFNRVVKRGTQGIALIDQSSHIPRLKYVFDVSDTVARIGGKNPYLWKTPPVAENYIVERLIQRFDVHPEHLVLDEFLHELTRQTVFSETEEALELLKERISGSFLEDLDDDNLSVRFSSLAAASLEYMLYTRCGIFAEDYLVQEDFGFITDFNTVEALSVLGETLGKYGLMRRNFLRDKKPAVFQSMLIRVTLWEHLWETEDKADEMEERLMKQMAEQEGVTEALKAADQMEWVRRMNSIQNRAEEMVKADLIYQ